MTTMNRTRFSSHYLGAAVALMDAIAEPTAGQFNDARVQAAFAKDYAGTDAERTLASRLLSSVMEAARAMGYTGYGE